VLTVDEALAEIEEVTADDIQRLASTLVVDDGLRLAAVAPARVLRGLERLLRLPA
jgi:predicted Zn-dependent peptidase